MDNNLGDNITTVYQNLLIFGKLYNFDMSDDDYYTFDIVHSVLTQVYEGVYPISEIMLKVTCDNLVFFFLQSMLTIFLFYRSLPNAPT